ncbi:MAG: hypothetical protein CMB99_11415 [Flavobacteriaceae bacterium]|nr:hypothetical protein [Flavobacteriaceae bacterium]|tara:strand:+ start:32810 stop:33352 length:543 start_codon:yes stop_codon:yes gene_type:complete
MTNRKIKIIKEQGKIPTDELDDFWQNFGAFFIIIIFLGFSVYAFYKGIISDNITTLHYVLFFSSLALLTLLIWAKKTEKNLKGVHTGLTLKQNKELIEKLCSDNRWIIIQNEKSYYQTYLTTFFDFYSHKLIFICSKKEVFYNLRTVGSFRGRIPMNFGLDFIKNYRIKRYIKNYAKRSI